MKIVRNSHLPTELRCKFVHVVRDLYINADPHEECLKLRQIRKWKEIDREAMAVYESDARFGGVQPGINYNCFDDFIEFVQCAAPLVETFNSLHASLLTEHTRAECFGCLVV